MIKLEVGKSYRNREGGVRTIIDKTNGQQYPFMDKGWASYTETGVWVVGVETNLDLIEEVSLVQPEQHTTTIQDLLQLHDNLCNEAKELMKKKNSDYTDGSVDPFSNFRVSETLGVDGRISILIRMTDKIQRLKTFVDKGELNNESVNDSVIDIINYAILFMGMCNEKRT